MAVREALLALLLTGPAYGFQLHGALATRTGGRRRINVGQSYATLERLTKAALIEPAGTTADGLPLHRLTPAGAAAAGDWLGGADASGSDPLEETIDRVLIAASLPGVDEHAVIGAELTRWQARLEAVAAGSPELKPRPAPGVDPAVFRTAELERLATAAEASRARSAIDWLATTAVAVASGSSLELEPTSERPKRGRRPAAQSAAVEASPAQPSAMA